jgi:hypothetical protein
MVSSVNSGRSTTIQTTQSEEAAPAQEAGASGHPQPPASGHPDLAARRTTTGTAAGERPRVDLGAFKASTSQAGASSSAEGGSQQVRRDDSLGRSARGQTAPFTHLLELARDDSLARQAFRSAHPLLAATESEQAAGRTDSIPRSESAGIRPDALRRALTRITESPDIAATGPGQSPLIGETRRSRLQAQMSLTDIVVEVPTDGQTGIPRDKGKAPASESPPLLPPGDRSDRFTFDTSSSINAGTQAHSAGIGQHRTGHTPSGEPETSNAPPRNSARHDVGRRDSSSSRRTVYSGGIGERRSAHRGDAPRRDPVTGSPIYTPRGSQRWQSGELPRTSPPGTSSSSSSETAQTTTATVTPNWRSAIADLARAAGQQVQQTASIATMVRPNPQLVAAAAGHLVHQAVSVGMPTFAREMLVAGLTVGLQGHANAVIGLQAGMMALNVTLQVVRERREAREPNEAARGFHSLSADDWNASSPQEQAAMRQTQARHSRLFTELQVAASALNLGLGIGNVRNGDVGSAISRVATDVKTTVYTTMRDALQASFRMSGIVDETLGLSGTHLTTAIATYAAVSLAGNYASQALVGSAAPQASTAANVRNGVLTPAEAGMSMAAAWGTAATVAGVKAAVNTVVEAIDWFQRTQLEAMEGGREHTLQPRINIAPEHRDYARLLDHLPARMALVNTINSVTGAAGYAARHTSAAMQSLIGNAGSVAVSAMLDYSVTNTWQAESAVRAALRPVEQEAEAGAEQQVAANPPPPPPPTLPHPEV